MNKHSSSLRSKNDIRRIRNQRERELIIPQVVARIIESTNRQTLNVQDTYPIDFDHPLATAIERVQKGIGITPYRLRDSKIDQIITLLEGPHAKDLLAPVADIHTDQNGNLYLQMFRA